MEESLLEQRETQAKLKSNYNDDLKKKCEEYFAEVNDFKHNIQPKDDINEYSEDEQSEMSRILQPQLMSKEEKEKNAAEVFKGNDELFEQHKEQVEAIFKESRGLQKEREFLLKESAENA